MTVRKLWGGRFQSGPSDLLRQFNDSFSFDHQLFAVDVEGSIVWARALEKAQVITADEAEKLVAVLQQIPAPKTFDDHEDVHSYVEAKLYEKA